MHLTQKYTEGLFLKVFCLSIPQNLGVTRVEPALLGLTEVMVVIGDKNQDSWLHALALPLAGFFILGTSFKFVLI